MSRMGQIKLAGWLSIPLCIAIIYVIHSFPQMFPYHGIWQIVIAGVALNTIVHARGQFYERFREIMTKTTCSIFFFHFFFFQL